VSATLDRPVRYAYDTPLAETTTGLHRNDRIRADSPFRGAPLRDLVDVELVSAKAETEYHGQFGRQPTGRLTAPEGA
jgi:putative transposase